MAELVEMTTLAGHLTLAWVWFFVNETVSKYGELRLICAQSASDLESEI